MPKSTVKASEIADSAAALPGEDPQERSARIRALAVAQRLALAARLHRENEFELAEKLDKCGLPASITCTNCGDPHSVETRCKRRWCPTCARKISFERVQKYEKRLCGMTWPLWCTFTCRNSDDAEVIDVLKAGWKQFRRRKIFKAYTKGGLWALEVTEKGKGWHPHLHAFLDCEWLSAHTPPPHPLDPPAIVREKMSYAKAELDEEWGSCVGQEWASTFVARKKADSAVRELLKYAVKGSDLLETTLPVGDLIRMIDAGRTISTFGTVRKSQAPAEDEDDKPKLACTTCGTEGEWLPTEVLSRYGRISPPTMIHFGHADNDSRNPFD